MGFTWERITILICISWLTGKADFFLCVFILLTFLFCALSFNIIFPFTNGSGSQPELNCSPEIMPGNIFGCYNLEMRAAAGISYLQGMG